MVAEVVGAGSVGRDAVAVLADAQAHRATAEEAERALLRTVLEWVALHPPEASAEAAAVRVGGRVGERPVLVPLNGEGAPQVASHAVAELAAALGMSTQAGQTLVADALELAYRLPALWSRVLAGQVACWRARRVARATPTLSREAAAFVDRNVAPAAGQAPTWQIDALVTEAIARHEPERHHEQLRRDMLRRSFDVDLAQTTLGGLVPVGGVVELSDALDLDAAVAHAAAQRVAWGDDESPGAVRARAVGDLAREHLAWFGEAAPGGSTVRVETGPDGTTVEVTGPGASSGVRPGDPERPSGPGGLSGPSGPEASSGDGLPAGSTPSTATSPRVAPPRQTVLYLHLTDTGLCRCARSDDEAGEGPGSRTPAWIGRAENTRTPIDAETVRRWCGAPGTSLSVRPVRDLAAELRSDAYEIPDRMAEQVRLRDGTCVFPYCAAPARTADLDHVVPYDHEHPERGGPTASSNLAPLCRRHHGLKTRRWWGYEVVGPTVYEWHDRFGNRYRTDRAGTSPLGGPDLPAAEP